MLMRRRDYPGDLLIALDALDEQLRCIKRIERRNLLTPALGRLMVLSNEVDQIVYEAEKFGKTDAELRQAFNSTMPRLMQTYHEMGTANEYTVRNFQLPISWVLIEQENLPRA